MVLVILEFRILVEHLVVGVMVDLVLELHGNVLLCESINDLRGELLFRPELDEFLLLTIKYDHENVLPTEYR